MQIHLQDPVTGEPRLITVGEGDMIVVRPREDHEHGVDDAMQLAEQIKASAPMKLVVVLGPSVELEALDEQAMAKHGWVRADTEPDRVG